jgi:predicted CXXCH cytochrome family protein
MNGRCTLIAGLLCLLLAIAVPVLAAGTNPQMAGGPHDFRNKTNPDYAGATGTGSEVCKACHIPHNATQDKFLWAHNYDNQAGGPGSLTTTLCVGCHDGTLATTINGMSKTATLPASATVTYGVNSKTHPVNVVYPTTSNFNQNHASPLESGQVTCGSCHDPHASPSNPNGLRMDNTGSALCVDCHVK